MDHPFIRITGQAILAATLIQFSAGSMADNGPCGIASLGSITTGASLNKDGSVWMWGFRNAGISGLSTPTHAYSNLNAPNQVTFPDNARVAELASGAYHFIALSTDGKVYGWGQSGYGEVGCRNQVNDPYVRPPCEVKFPGLKADDRIVHVAAGEYFSLAMTAQGDIYTWGHDLYGQIGRGNNVTTNTSGPVKNVSHPSYSDGRLVPKNNDSMQFVPYKVDLGGETAVVAGAWYEGAMVVTVNAYGQRKAWGWGDNEAGGLGVPYTCSGTPIRGVQCVVRQPTRTLSAFDAIAAKATYLSGGNAFGTAMLSSTNTSNSPALYGWGQLAAIGLGTNSLGKPGDTTAATLTPLPMRLIDPSTGVESQPVKFFSRYVGNVAIGSDDRLWVWGQGGGSAFTQIYPPRPTPHGTAFTSPPDLKANSALRSDRPGARVVNIGGTKEVVYYQMDDGSAYGVGYASVDSLNPIGIPSAGKADVTYWGPGKFGGSGTMHGSGNLESVLFGGVRLFGNNGTSNVGFTCGAAVPPPPDL